MTFSCYLILPPQVPLRHGSNARFHATAYLDGIDVHRFRERIAIEALFLVAEIHASSTDDLPLARGRVMLGPSAGERDIVIVIDLDQGCLPTAGERLLVLACVTDRGGRSRDSGAQACLVVTSDDCQDDARTRHD